MDWLHFGWFLLVPRASSKAWRFVLFTRLHVCSKFLWDEKQTILRWWFERTFVLLNFKAPQWLQLYSIELQHSISYTLTFFFAARCQELMSEPCPNFLQRFIKCHFISAPFIKHKPLRPQISQQTFATHKVHSWKKNSKLDMFAFFLQWRQKPVNQWCVIG